jgi:cytochrome c biogenesis protein CcdA
MIEILTAFGGGLLASLSPCVYPLIPITVSFLGRTNSLKPIYVFTAGKIVTLMILGLMAVQASEALGYVSTLPWVQYTVGTVLLVLGTFSYLERLPAMLGKINIYTDKISGSAFLLGVGSALLVSPCTTPILYSVLMIIATSPSQIYGMSVMLAYSVGFSLLFFLFGIGIVNKLPKLGKYMKYVQKLSSLALIGLGIYYILQAFLA